MYKLLNNLQLSPISKTLFQFDFFPLSFQDNIQHRFPIIKKSLKECLFLIILDVEIGMCNLYRIIT